jgi:hypothetical protein
LKQRILRITLLPVILFALLFIVGFGVSVHAPVAHASSNGQQIGVVTYQYSAKIYGNNQNGQATSECISTPDVPPQWNPGNVTWNWWWKGYATVYVYSSGTCSGSYVAVLTCNVPTSQSSNFYVFDFTSHTCYAG